MAAVAQTVREEVVQELVAAAYAGMTCAAQGTRAAEVFSAGLTIAGRTIDVALELGVDPEVLRDAVTKLWEKLPPTQGGRVNGFELDRRIREILITARPETVLSSTAALVELGFGARQSYLMIEKVILERPNGNEAHDPSAHSELPGEEPRPDRVADQQGHQEVGRPRVRGTRQGRPREEGQRVAHQGSSRRPVVRWLQGVTTRSILNPRAVYTLPQSYSQIRTLYYAETRQRVLHGGVRIEDY